MCWGFRPTLAFVLGELAVLVFVFARNKRNDRTNCFLHAPFFGQEVIQLLIWARLALDPGATPEACEPPNAWLSLLVGTVGCFIPAWVALWLSLAWPPQPGRHIVRRKLWSWAVFCAGFAAFEVAVIVAEQAAGVCPRCTVAGPWGHQVWPFMHIRPKLLALGHYFPYASLIGVSIVLAVQHLEGLAAWCFASIWWHPPVLYMVIGDEWASFWCFGSSLICAIFVVEPYLLDAFLTYLQSQGFHRPSIEAFAVADNGAARGAGVLRDACEVVALLRGDPAGHVQLPTCVPPSRAPVPAVFGAGEDAEQEELQAVASSGA